MYRRFGLFFSSPSFSDSVRLYLCLWYFLLNAIVFKLTLYLKFMLFCYPRNLENVVLTLRCRKHSFSILAALRIY